jgi:type 1 glutamine amidotransferase
MRYATILVLCALKLLGGYRAAAGGDGQLKVCILSGCEEYKTEESLPAFQQFLDSHYNTQCTRLVRKAVDNLPGLEALDDCDVALIYIKRMELKGDQLERFKKYVTSGKPIVGVRTASHAVQTWLDFDKGILGGNYTTHFGVGPLTTVEIPRGAEQHPVLAGVDLKTVGDWLYKNEGHASDIHILLNGTIPGEPTQPIAWTRDYKGGRVFYTSLGTPQTFELPAFRQMLVNALYWTAHRDVEPRKP